ncbi:aldehyde dehydrogenase family protein, partial [Burkholderia gladioli]
MNAASILSELGIDHLVQGGELAVHSPIDGRLIARVATQGEAEVDAALAAAQQAFLAWREVPAPRRGELVRILGNKLREKKQALGALITLEAG